MDDRRPNGGALVFNGVDNLVTVPADPALNLTTGMTVEGVGLSDGDCQPRNIAMKEGLTDLWYALYASDATSRPEVDHQYGERRSGLRHWQLPRECLVPPGYDVRRLYSPAVRQRCAGRECECRRHLGPDLRAVPDRRQQPLGRMVQWRDRRHAGLRSRPEHDRNPDRHEHGRGAAAH